jgi:hypothetical protein
MMEQMQKLKIDKPPTDDRLTPFERFKHATEKILAFPRPSPKQSKKKEHS